MSLYNVINVAELFLHGAWVISYLSRSKWPANQSNDEDDNNNNKKCITNYDNNN